MSDRDDERHHHPPDPSELAELALLREQIKLQKLALAELKTSHHLQKLTLVELEAIRRELMPGKLTTIKLTLTPGDMPMPAEPLTISVGQSFTASVIGFDQNGAPFSGTLPVATFAVDNSAVATVDPTSGAGQGVSAGVASVTGSLTTDEGLALSDDETVTVTSAAQILSSIKVSLDSGAGGSGGSGAAPRRR